MPSGTHPESTPLDPAVRIKNDTARPIKGVVGGQPVLVSPGDYVMFHNPCEEVEFVNSAVYEPLNPMDPPEPVEFNESARAHFEGLRQWTRPDNHPCPEPLRELTFVRNKTERGTPDNTKLGPSGDAAERQGGVLTPPKAQVDVLRTLVFGDLPWGLRPASWAPSAYQQGIGLGYPLGSPRSLTQILGSDPVDLFSGAFFINDADLVVPGTLVPLALSRVYRSRAPYLGPFGWGWDHNHNIFLRELANGDIARWNGRLREEVFVAQGDDYTSPPGLFERLVKVADGEYRVDARFGTTVLFRRPAGWTNDYKIPIAELSDRFGNKLVYDYDSENRVAAVTCVPADAPTGSAFHHLLFEYGECGLLEAVRDSVGRVVYYDHHPDIQHLVRVRFPATGDHPNGTRRIYRYADMNGDPELMHNIISVEDDGGRVFVENEYDDDPASWSFGHVIRQVYGGNEYANRYTQIQAVPQLPEYLNEPYVQVEAFAPDKSLTTYTFNYQGNLLDRRLRLNRDKSWRIVAWSYTYDAEGNLVRILEPDGSAEVLTYDHENADPRMRGNLLRRTIESAAMFQSRVVWIGTYEPTYQLLTSETEEAGDGFSQAQLKAQYAYGSLGKMLSITYPDATLPDGTTQTALTQFEVNARGQVTARISPTGVRGEFEYDETPTMARGRLNATIQDAGGLALRTEHEYDAFGFVRGTVEPGGGRVDTERNALGLVERQVWPEVDGHRSDTRLHYDGDGKVVRIERARGAYQDDRLQGAYIVDSIRRNAIGYPVGMEIGTNTAEPRVTGRVVDYRGLPVTVTNPDGSVTSTLYDERGMLLREEVRGADGTVTTRRIVYDVMGRPVEAITGPAGDGRQRYHYDGYGRLTRTDRVRLQADGTAVGIGATAVNIWSDRGLLIRREMRAYPGDAGSTVLAVEEFEYDQRRRLMRSVERPFTTTFDEATTPRLVSEYYHDAEGRLAKRVDPRGGATLAVYDAIGRLVEESDPLGNGRTYAYDLDQRTVALTLHDIEPGGGVKLRTFTQRFDARGRLIEAIEPDGASARVEYDDRDLAVAIVDQRGVRYERTFGLLGEMRASTCDPGGLAITNRWAHDSVGRVTRYEDPTGEATTYAYDGIGRLVGSQLPGGARTARVYGADGRMLETRLASGVRIQYTYDSAGRIASSRAGGVAGATAVPVHTFAYDDLDRLISAQAGGLTVSRSYDSLGRLVAETSHGVALGMAYDDLAGTMLRSWADGRQERHTADLNGFVTKIERLASGGLGSGPALLGDFTPYGPSMLGKAELANAAVTTTLTYDERKRVSETRHVNAAAALEKAIYRYDSANRRRVELLEAGTVQRRLHRFDNRRRLVQTDEDFGPPALGAGYTQAQHDADIAAVESNAATATVKYEFQLNTSDSRTLVRRTGQPDRAYTYGSGHRLAAAGADTFLHSVDGTRTADGANRYEVDALGRVVRVSDPAGTTTRTALAYDPLGRVASITDASGARSDLSYFGGELWQESRAGAAVRQYSRHHRMYGAVSTHTAGASYLTLHDARLNLLAITDTSGTALHRYRYQPFGTPDTTTSAAGLEPAFGGMRYLADAGLYLAGLRLMDPSHGAWLSPDPAGYADSPDLYAYVAGNPIDYADPAGAQLGMSGSFHAPPDALRQNTPFGAPIGQTWKSDRKVYDIVHQDDAAFSILGDIYNSTKYWAPGIYYGGYAVAGFTIGALEVFNDPWEYGIKRPVMGLWTLAKAATPAYWMLDPKGALEAQLELGGGIVTMFANPEEGAFEFGRGAAHNFALTAATEGVGGWLRGGRVGVELVNEGAGIGEGSTRFYSVQDASDAARLRGPGTPWPTEPSRAALGEGVYAWGIRGDAEMYLQLISRRVPDLELVEFSIDNVTLANLRQLNVDLLDNPESWMQRYSRLWGGTPDHGLEYIQRGTNLGTEHYFHHSVFDKLTFHF